MHSWPAVNAWRKEQRRELIAQRTARLQGERQALAAKVTTNVVRLLPPLGDAVVGFYWPFKAEWDPRPLVRELIESGAAAALPVVVEKNHPLEFWRWTPGMKLRRGIWDIPIPAERDPVLPNLALVPLVGFDEAGYRLGYGGGYFDRTLAALPQKPFCIGVGYELGFLSTIYPQSFDVPMDAIVTEARSARVLERRLAAL